MEKVILNSSALKSAEYTEGKMILVFHRGTSYSYNVDESVYRGLITADSAGRFFSQHIRKQFTGKKL
jgi:hypothetical protein